MIAATKLDPIVHEAGICSSTCDHREPNAAQVEACCEWLRRWAMPTATISLRRGSYALKHLVENASAQTGVVHLQTDRHGRRWGGRYLYVSNGAFITAALLEGYQMRQAGPDSLNAFFNLTVRRTPLVPVPTVLIHGLH